VLTGGAARGLNESADFSDQGAEIVGFRFHQDGSFGHMSFLFHRACASINRDFDCPLSRRFCRTFSYPRNS
jgi:hypothetical protein